MTTKWNKENILTALDRSIDKWGQIVNNKFKASFSINCPLCGECPDCKDCPITAHTNQNSCEGTPFYQTSVWGKCIGAKVNKKHRKADKKMLAFLHMVQQDLISDDKQTAIH
jgi:hypothetical protein